MKPFNLEKAKAGKPVVTSDGRPARIICWDKEDCDGQWVIVALVKNQGVHEFAQEYTISGRARIGIRGLDLVMATVERTVYINFWESHNGGLCSSWPFESEVDARNATFGSKAEYTNIAVPVVIQE